MKSGLILEGGGVRGAFIAGVLDVFIEEGLSFDYACGVSAGASALSNFISGQQGRTKEGLISKEGLSYYGIKEFFRSGQYMNLDKLYGKDMFTKEPVFDIDKFFSNPTEVEVVATNCTTGKAEYLSDDKTIDSYCQVFKATCSLPIICKPCKIGEKFYMDGSISDPIPIDHAMQKGCEKIIFLSTKGEGDKPSNLKKYIWFMKIIYPSSFKPLFEAIKVRIPLLEGQYKHAAELGDEGKVLTICPSGKNSVSHMDRNMEKIEDLYEEGRETAKRMMPQVREFIGQ